ncbi:MAG: hypothetical protein FJ104_09810, partial [Deltaproteobacteria bacterium]|nr:hypothetical protein [Deltaproteobacteria bacterium]
LIVGHTHLAFARPVAHRRGLVCNPGALLRDPAHPMDGTALFDRATGTFEPAPGPGGGTFGVLELPAMRFTVHLARDGSVAPTGHGPAGKSPRGPPSHGDP